MKIRNFQGKLGEENFKTVNTCRVEIIFSEA